MDISTLQQVIDSLDQDLDRASALYRENPNSEYAAGRTTGILEARLLVQVLLQKETEFRSGSHA